MDDFTNQVIDIVWENDAIKSKVEKAKPYVGAFLLVQILMFLMLIFLVQRSFSSSV